MSCTYCVSMKFSLFYIVTHYIKMDKTSWILVCDIHGDKAITGNYNYNFNELLQHI